MEEVGGGVEVEKEREERWEVGWCEMIVCSVMTAIKI